MDHHLNYKASPVPVFIAFIAHVVGSYGAGAMLGFMGSTNENAS
jgi:hypothetical protein